MTPTDPLLRLFRDWLQDAAGQVAAYRRNNGNTLPDPAAVVLACPACLGSEAVVQWALLEVERWVSAVDSGSCA